MASPVSTNNTKLFLRSPSPSLESSSSSSNSAATAAGQSSPAYRQGPSAKHLVPKVKFDPTPLYDGAGNLINQWGNALLNNSSVQWAESVFQRIPGFIEARDKYLLDQNILNELLQKPLPENFAADLTHRQQIQEATDKAKTSAAALHRLVKEIQAVKSSRKPNSFMRDPPIADKINATYRVWVKPWELELPSLKQSLKSIQQYQTRAINRDRAYLHLTNKCPEFQNLLNLIFSPKTTDLERAKFLEQLGIVKDQIYASAAEVLPSPTTLPTVTSHKRLHGHKKIKQTAETRAFPLTPDQRDEIIPISTDFLSQVSSDYEDAEFRAQPYEDNLSSLRALREQGQRDARYARRVASLGARLLGGDKPKECLDFVSEWTQRPQELSLEDILQMGELFVAARQKIRPPASAADPDTVEIPASGVDAHRNLSAWLDAHPELQINREELLARRRSEEEHKSATASDLPLTDPENLELLRGHLASLGNELSAEVLDCYENCDLINPSPKWKFHQGAGYAATSQFEKSQRIIDLLKDCPELADPLKGKHALQQYGLATATMDLATTGLQWFIKKRPKVGKKADALHGLNIALQAASNPLLARTWIPYCTSHPKQLRADSEFLKGQIGIIKGIWEGFRLVKTVTLSSAALIEKYGSTERQKQFKRYQPVLTGITELELTCSSLHRISKLKVFESLKTLDGITSLTSNVALLAIQASTAAISLACLLKKRFSKPSDISATWRALEDTTYAVSNDMAVVNIGYAASNLTCFIYRWPRWAIKTVATTASVISTVYQGVIVIGKNVYRFSPTKTAHFLQDVHSYCVLEKFDDAHRLLSSAKNYWFIDKIIVDQYGECMEFFKLISHLEDSSDSRQKLETSIIKVDATITKMAGNNLYDSLNQGLVHHKILAYLTCKETEKATKELQSSNLCPEYIKDIALTVISRAIRLISQEQYGDATKYLDMLSITALNNHKSLMDTCKQYIAERQKMAELSQKASDADIASVIDLLNDIIKKIPNDTQFTPSLQALNYEKVRVYLLTERYDKSYVVLNDGSVGSKFLTRAVRHLIRVAYNLGETGDFSKAHTFLENANIKLKINELQEPINCTVAFLAVRKRNAAFTLTDAEKTTLFEALDKLIENLKDDEFSDLKLGFQLQKLFILLRLNGFTKTNDLVKTFTPIEQAKLAQYLFEKVEQLLRKNKWKEAADIANQCNAVTFDYTNFFSKYKNYIAYIQRQKTLIPTDEISAKELITITDEILATISNSSFLSELRTSLALKKALAHLNSRGQTELNQLLNQEPECEDLTADYLIRRTLEIASEQGNQKALDYLNPNIDLKFKHKDLIDGFQKYLSDLTTGKDAITLLARLDNVLTKLSTTDSFSVVHTLLLHKKLQILLDEKKYTEAKILLGKDPEEDFTAIHLIKKTNRLIAEGKYTEALTFLQETEQLNSKHIGCFSKYQNYVKCWEKQKGLIPTEKQKADNFIQSIDDVLSQIEKIPNKYEVEFLLQHNKLLTCMQIEDYSKVKSILNQKHLTQELEPILVRETIGKSENIRICNGIKKARLFAKRIIDAKIDNSTIKKYIKLAENLEEEPTIQTNNDVPTILNIISMIDELLSELKDASPFPGLKGTKSDLYQDLGAFELNRDNLAQVIIYYSAAKAALPEGCQHLEQPIELIIKAAQERLQQRRAS